MTSPGVPVEAAPLKPGAAVTSAGVCPQCICGGTEEATQPWQTVWWSWKTTRFTCFPPPTIEIFTVETLVIYLWSMRKAWRLNTFLNEVFFCFFFFPQEYMEFRKERAKMLISRRNQLLLEFSFWNEPVPRPGPNIYELRTYHLEVSTRSRVELFMSALCSTTQLMLLRGPVWAAELLWDSIPVCVLRPISCVFNANAGPLCSRFSQELWSNGETTGEAQLVSHDPLSCECQIIPWSKCGGDPYTSLMPCVWTRARAIRHRQENNEAVGGFFSQIGLLYVVYHLWGEVQAFCLISGLASDFTWI